MVKPRGPLCNLDCAYCYYLSKERLYPGSPFRMSDSVLEAFTRQYIEAQSVPEVTFAWQGGEPTLMGVDFYAGALALQKKYGRPGMRISNTLQTNGTLLDDTWCRFFRENDFLIGISLDGPRAVHDAYRVDKAGRPTFDRVMAGVALLRKHGVKFNILTTVHTASVGHPLSVYQFLRDEVGGSFLQFIPIVGRNAQRGVPQGGCVTARSVTGRQYGDFLIAVFEEWAQEDVGRVFVQLFDVALAAWVGQRPGLCQFEETCGNALVLEHNGDLYSCDHFVEPDCRLGNIEKTPLVEMVASERQQRFGRDKQDTLPRSCRDCAVHFVCRGGCPKNRTGRTLDGAIGTNILCEGYRAFFEHVDRPMRMMAAELRAGRPPANIMRLLAEEAREGKRRLARTGRNERCPCGSGRKFKQCCGQRRPQEPAHRGDSSPQIQRGTA
ncbi:MAG: anaerobic sulfatase maturase [Candidatus Latescibacterota bacterium]